MNIHCSYASQRQAPAEDSLGRIGLHDQATLGVKMQALFDETRAARGLASVVIANIDGLRAINRRHGVAAGDAVLAHVSELVAMNIQPGVDLAGRLAGAELVIMLPEADAQWAITFAERLRGTLANRPLHYGGEWINLSACFGVADIASVDRNVADLIDRAQSAVDAAKAVGNNAVRQAPSLPVAA